MAIPALRGNSQVRCDIILPGGEDCPPGGGGGRRSSQRLVALRIRSYLRKVVGVDQSGEVAEEDREVPES